MIPIEDREMQQDQYLFMATRSGMVKKTPLYDFRNVRKNGLAAITLREDDQLIEVKYTDGNQDVFMATKKGMSIRFSEKDVRPTGRGSMGVWGIRLDPDDEVIGMQLRSQGEYLLFASEKGMGKRTAAEAFKIQHRGGKGVICYRLMEKTGDLIGVKAVNEDNEVMLITSEGIIIRTPVSGISVMGRSASGVKLIRTEDTVASIAKVREDDTDDADLPDENAEDETGFEELSDEEPDTEESGQPEEDA